VAGFRVIRPFGFVRATNDSLGSPGWFALDALFVDTGWIAADDPRELPIREANYDPLSEEPTRLDGTIVRLSEEDAEAFSKPLVEVGIAFDASPDGAGYVPFLLRLPER
jgi:hypothetical protein